MICKKCGADIPDSATFCTECGQPTKRESYEMPSLDEPVQQYQPINFPGQNKIEEFTLPPPPVIENPEGSPRFVGFKDAVILYFKNALNFQGRSTRSEYWYSILFYILVTFAVTLILGKTGVNLSYILPVVFFVPNLAVLVRRMHDVGKSALPIMIYYGIYSLMQVYYDYKYRSILTGSFTGEREQISSILLILPLFLLIGGIYFLVQCCTMSEMRDNKYGRKPH